MKFTLPPLPYAENALAPHLSAETLRLHHGAHHKAYVDRLNTLLEDQKAAAGKSLTEVVQWSAESESRKGIFNSAAQAWNHEFYWESLTPVRTAPGEELAKLIDRDFGSLDGVKKALTDAAVSHFGSGWAWLVADKGKLKVVSTHDAGSPLVAGQRPLLAVDVWEHAYYVDYRNRRPDYVKAVVNELLNWKFAADNLRDASKPAAA